MYDKISAINDARISNNIHPKRFTRFSIEKGAQGSFALLLFNLRLTLERDYISANNWSLGIDGREFMTDRSTMARKCFRVFKLLTT